MANKFQQADGSHPIAPIGDLGCATRAGCLVIRADRAYPSGDPVRCDQSAKCSRASQSQPARTHSGVNWIRYAGAGGPRRRRAVAVREGRSRGLHAGDNSEMTIAPVLGMSSLKMRYLGTIIHEDGRALDAPNPEVQQRMAGYSLRQHSKYSIIEGVVSFFRARVHGDTYTGSLSVFVVAPTSSAGIATHTRAGPILRSAV